jgi:glutathione S-transferase
MAAPLVMPREYGIRLPLPEDLPPGMRAEVEGYRATAAGRFALRMFEKERAARGTLAPPGRDPA